jgi:hypothetical protein
MHVYVRPECEPSSRRRRSPSGCLAAREGEHPMTCRRLVPAAADHLVTAISLAFWLSSWAKIGPYVAGTPALAKAALRIGPDPLPTVREPDSTGAVDQHGPTVSAGRAAVSLIPPGTPARAWTPRANRGNHSTSSGSEQIPLLVGALGRPETGLRRTEVRTRRGQFDGRSLNPKLSLERSVA